MDLQKSKRPRKKNMTGYLMTKKNRVLGHSGNLRTPREEEIETDRNQLSSGKKMIGRTGRHTDADERFTATNSNSMKSTPILNNAKKIPNSENFSETLQSERDNADDLLLHLR